MSHNSIRCCDYFKGLENEVQELTTKLEPIKEELCFLPKAVSVNSGTFGSSEEADVSWRENPVCAQEPAQTAVEFRVGQVAPKQ